MLKNRGGKVLEYTVRKAVPSDKARVEALFLEMLQAIYNRKDVDGYKEGDIDRFFAGAGDWIYVAEAEGRVEAFLSIEEHHEPADYIYLDDFSVSTPCRGRGIGMALLKAAEQYARDRGIPQVVLHVEKSNLRARRLYERSGFTDDKDEGGRIRMKKLV